MGIEFSISSLKGSYSVKPVSASVLFLCASTSPCGWLSIRTVPCPLSQGRMLLHTMLGMRSQPCKAQGWAEPLMPGSPPQSWTPVTIGENTLPCAFFRVQHHILPLIELYQPHRY